MGFLISDYHIQILFIIRSVITVIYVLLIYTYTMYFNYAFIIIIIIMIFSNIIIISSSRSNIVIVIVFVVVIVITGPGGKCVVASVVYSPLAGFLQTKPFWWEQSKSFHILKVGRKQSSKMNDDSNDNIIIYL